MTPDGPLRLLYISRNYSTHDHRFLSALAERGCGETACELHFLALQDTGSSAEDRPLPPSVTRHRLSNPLLPTNGAWPLPPGRLPGLLRELGGLLRAVRPDIVQAGPLQTAALLVALTGYQPLVSMSWGYDLLIDARRNWVWRWATRLALRCSRAMVGDCDTMRRLAVSHGMTDGRIVTFPWGADIEQYTPGQHVPGSGLAFTLLSTRGWEPIYGVELIAEAFGLAAQALHGEPDTPPLRLVMLGNGSLAGRLRQIFARYSVEAQVLLPGQVSQARLAQFYQSADLYVSASHSDGTSISLLEALACGRPALVSDIPGNCEWIVPGGNGWWFPDGDAIALSERILAAVRGRAGLAALGRRARQTAEARGDWRQNFPHLYEAFRIALKP
jgi:glycosyltransferase involved in cell wall biosynthesis